MPENLHIVSRQRRKSGFAVSLAGFLLIGLFSWTIAIGVYSNLDGRALAVGLFLLGIGIALPVTGFLGGFVQEHLTITDAGMIYEWGIIRRRILWKDLRRASILGIHIPASTSYAIVMHSLGTRIGVGPDFNKEDLEKVSGYLHRMRKTFAFELVESE